MRSSTCWSSAVPSGAGIVGKVEGRGATTRAVSDDVDVLAAQQVHVGRAAGARAGCEWDILTVDSQVERYISRGRRTFQRHDIHQEGVRPRLGRADRKADQYLARILA